MSCDPQDLTPTQATEAVRKAPAGNPEHDMKAEHSPYLISPRPVEITFSIISTTVGLLCSRANRKPSLIRVEIERGSDGSIRLTPVSGNTLERVGASVTIKAERYDARPFNAYNNVTEARWALQIVGFSICGDRS